MKQRGRESRVLSPLGMLFDTVKTSSGCPKAEATTAFIGEDSVESVVMLVEDVVKQRRKKDTNGK
jgi:hypothetical protein